MTEPTLSEPFIPRETWAIAMMQQLRNTLADIDVNPSARQEKPLAETCDWNGLMIKLRQKGKEITTSTKVQVIARNPDEKDPLVTHLVTNKHFQALVLIDNLEKTLAEINPGYKSALPDLNGLQHRLHTRLIEANFKPTQFDDALLKVTVGL